MNTHRSNAAKQIYVDNNKLSNNAVKKILKNHNKTNQEAIKESRELHLNISEYLNFLNEF